MAKKIGAIVSLEEDLNDSLFGKLPENIHKEIIEDYQSFERSTVGQLDQKDTSEKNMILLGISRKLFTQL